MILRPDQHELIESVKQGLDIHRSVLLVCPTGSGKTVMFCALTKQFLEDGKRVMILAHRGELLEQISRTLRAFHVPHGLISPQYPKNHQRPIQVASVFSLIKRMPYLPHPDVLIVDEAHHVASGSTWSKILRHWLVPTIGVTATPQRLDGQGLHQFFNEMIIGPSTKALIEHGLLSPYVAYAPPVHFSKKIPIRMGDYAIEALGEEMSRTTLVGDIVQHYQKLAHGKRALAFCVSIRHAQQVARQFREANYVAEHLDGTMAIKDRNRIIDGFRNGQIHILTSCNLVSEGFDLPAIEVAILARPTKSLALYLQQVGRALRTYPGKSQALILDHANNIAAHGLPDDEFAWSLQGQERKVAKSPVAVPSVKICDRCFAANSPGVQACQNCGYVFVAKTAIPTETTDSLEQVIRSNIIQKQRRREVGMARTFEDLKKIAKQRGYHPRWAHIMWNIRQGKPKYARI